MTTVAEAYAGRAREYADKIGSMDAVHPDDRHLVQRWARSVRGPLLDAGCGPGHWAGHLAGRGHDVHGVDAVPAFVALARAHHPSVRFDVGSIDALDMPDGEVGGILAWFSTIHHAPSSIHVPLREFSRVLKPGGSLLLGYFDSPDAVAPFDHAVIRAYRWPVSDLSAALQSAGFAVVETHRRSAHGQRDVGAIVCERQAPAA